MCICLQSSCHGYGRDRGPRRGVRWISCHSSGVGRDSRWISCHSSGVGRGAR